MTKKAIHLLVVVLLINWFCYSQEINNDSNDDEKSIKHAIGSFYSLDSGLGLSYRFSINNIRVQASILPTYIYFEPAYYVQFTGLGLQYRYFTNNTIDLYAYVGNNIFFLYEQNELYLKDNISGIGLGLDYNFSKKWSLQFQLGYGLISRNKSIINYRFKNFISPGFGIMRSF